MLQPCSVRRKWESGQIGENEIRSGDLYHCKWLSYFLLPLPFDVNAFPNYFIRWNLFLLSKKDFPSALEDKPFRVKVFLQELKAFVWVASFNKISCSSFMKGGLDFHIWLMFSLRRTLSPCHSFELWVIHRFVLKKMGDGWSKGKKKSLNSTASGIIYYLAFGFWKE